MSETRRGGIGPREAIDAATEWYLRGRTLDLSALAFDLGIGRATLYRWVGNREELLALILAEATERTFRTAAGDATGAGGELVLDTLEKFMRAVADSEPLQALTQREPLLFIRLATTPGAIERRASGLIAELLEAESVAGRLALPLPAATLAEAIVRICDSHLYAHLLGGAEPEIDTAIAVVAVLLRTGPGGSCRDDIPEV
ncbi:TetR family transcriptional regulator [Halopolyspora algeriensis]|uniref:TetR family transcriptional regulator n=1 Tax=Halopolyspora algeriensis TaxID=1500506 RepID=A0A368VEM2_9ACTN|nr:QsdR family transcriptional regulator [Halopolyspora algeriensis]RCW39649.1 TetR family transcriptional regulator [Halopolyspora algeriensis]TQM54058.1 TetR family transcriptional regulator [Halopolyspora algeriensis]